MFGFPDSTHEVYKNNFLRQVNIVFQFEKNVNSIEYFEIFYNLFKDDYPIKQEGNQQGWNINLSNNGGNITQEKMDIQNKFLILKTNNDNSVLELKNNELVLSFIGNEYKSFDSISVIITKIQKFIFDNLNIKFIENLSLRKLNLLEFNESIENISEMSYEAFNDLITYSFDIPVKKHVINDFRTITLKHENDFMIIKYGLNSPKNISGNTNHIFIDTTLTSAKIEVGEIIVKLNAINKEVFNAFNWIVNEKLIELLKN